MWAERLLERYYQHSRYTYDILLTHSKAVAEKAVKIAQDLKSTPLDIEFIYNSAILHDIGIFMTYSEKLECYGRYPYITHGYWGSEILISEGLIRYARVCETHVGVGLTVDDIKAMKLPIPPKDMSPVTFEEKIVCYADKFFSKKRGSLTSEIPLAHVREQIRGYGEEKLKRFDELHRLFNPHGCD
ncbi:MAG: HD domain-containing protein [Thermodesulfovibrionales bacterium]